MGADSEISWTRHTFNPWIGCARVSEGCRFCYAEAQSNRWKRAEWGVDKQRVMTSDAYWKQPFKWDAAALAALERHRVFCASLADVFDAHPGVVEQRARLWPLIAGTVNLDWLLLTKRPENVMAMLPADWGAGYPNAWLGTTVEDERVVARIDALRAIPAAVRFLSVEPMIGPLELRGRLDGIDWVIVGGESGNGARALDIAWIRDVIGVCRKAGVAVHVKQLGAMYNRNTSDGRLFRGDPKGGDINRWPEDLRIREYPAVTA